MTDATRDYINLFAKIKARLDYLKNVVVPEDRCTPVSESSERDFYRFLEKIKFTRHPYIYLLDNGDLRAVWVNVNGDELSVRFLGNNDISLYIKRPSIDLLYYNTSSFILGNPNCILGQYDLSGLLTDNATLGE